LHPGKNKDRDEAHLSTQKPGAAYFFIIFEKGFVKNKNNKNLTEL